MSLISAFRRLRKASLSDNWSQTNKGQTTPLTPVLLLKGPSPLAFPPMKVLVRYGCRNLKWSGMNLYILYNMLMVL